MKEKFYEFIKNCGVPKHTAAGIYCITKKFYIRIVDFNIQGFSQLKKVFTILW